MKNKTTLKAEGFDDCVVGIGSRMDNDVPIIIYDYDKCVKTLAEKNSMSLEDAMEYMDFNVTGAWLGDGTPMFVRVADNMDEIDDILSDIGGESAVENMGEEVDSDE
jgi:hypothetical protein